jgi:hypothetical protein
MKLIKLFTGLFLALATASAVAEYDKVLCPSGSTPVRVPGGWQCHSAQPGDPQIVYPKDEKRAGFDGQYECRLRPEYQTEYEVDMSPEHDLEDYEHVVEEEAQPMRRARNRIRRGPFIASEWY